MRVRPFVRVPRFELRFSCDMAVRWYAMAMERMALECMQVEMGWGEWAGQVEHSSRGEQEYAFLRRIQMRVRAMERTH